MGSRNQLDRVCVPQALGGRNSDELIELARQSLLSHFADLCDGLVFVDAQARIVWMNDSYPQRLGLLGTQDMIGSPVEAAIPNSLMRQVVESGKPIMLDIMDFGSQSFVVTRLPLKDAEGRILGAVGMVLYDDPRRLAPVVARYQRLRAELADAQRRLAEARRTRYTFASFVGVNFACLELSRRRAVLHGPPLPY